MVSELQIPEAVVDRYESGERKKRHLEQAKLVIEALTLAAVIFYAGIAYFQLSEMRQTTWLAFQDRLDNAPLPRDPTKRALADSGRAGAQPKAPAKDKETATDKKVESGAVAPQPPLAKQPAPSVDEEQRKQTRETIEINRQVAQYTGQLATLTFALVVVTLVLGVAAGIQALIARDTEKRQLRAYVGIKTAQLSRSDTGEGIQFSAAVRVWNFGQTPAHNVTMTLYLGTGDYPIDEAAFEPFRPEVVQSERVVWPENSFETIGRTEVLDYSEASTTAVYLLGQIRYQDVFRKWRTTDFRMVNHPLVNDLTGPGGFAFHERGNRAT